MSDDRRWFNVGVVKLPAAERDVAAAVFRGHGDRFFDIIGADTDDHDETHPIGSHTTYSAYLTEAEAEAFASASNVRWIAPNVYETDVLCSPQRLPDTRTMRWLDAGYDAYPTLTGTGVKVAVLDDGTTSASRNYKNMTLVGRQLFMPTTPAGEIWSTTRIHGCLSSGNAVPYGGQLLDAFCIDSAGGTSDAYVAAAIVWAVDNGAKVVNISIALTTLLPAVEDAFDYAAAFDVIFFCAAGNDNQRAVPAPAYYSQVYSYVHSVMSLDMSRNQRSSFSNWGPFITGASPGELVHSTSYDATEMEWSGTSAASPITAQVAARIISSGVTARQAGTGLLQGRRDFGLGEQQGGGAYSMEQALAFLGTTPPAARPVHPHYLGRAVAEYAGFGAAPFGVSAFGGVA